MSTCNSARLILFALVLFVSIPDTYAGQSKQSGDSDVYQLIMSRIRQTHLIVDIQKLEESVDSHFKILQQDGSFNDIDYSNRAQTAWAPLAHLDRLGDMVVAYVKEGNKYYQDDKLYAYIVSSLSFWYDKHPTSTNWYMQQMATPHRVGVMLILMRDGKKQLPPSLENNLLIRMEIDGNRPDQQGSFGTAANKMDIATHWIYRACLRESPEMLSFAVNQAFHPLFLTTREGLQYDYSYHQHGSQLYIGGYGYVIIEGITRLATYLRDTPYALPEEKKEYLRDFVLKSYLPVIRGKYYLYNVMGRGMTRVGSLDQSSFSAVLEKMIALDPANEKVYTNAIERLKGRQKSGYSLEPFNTHFWRSDYTLHQRPDYTFDVRMASIYTCRNENGNGEGLNGYFLTDGANTIVRDGDEYYNIFPVWDWARIPGVTNPVMKEIPRPRAWQTRGISDFAGGVSDGMYAVSAYALNDTAFNVNTSAKKSWFIFEDEIVCLGAGINSQNEQAVNTTINQCLLKTDISASKGGKILKLGRKADFPSDSFSWILHNGVGYYFPQAGNINLKADTQCGTWKSINEPSSNQLIEEEVFKLWLDHGVKPKDENYAYFILPNKNSVSEMKKYNPSFLSILENTDTVQAVLHKELNIMGIVFYQPATFSGNNISVTTDKPCVLMIKDIDKYQSQVYISDPSRKEAVINLNVKVHKRNAVDLKCELPVYPDAYAGSTKRYLLND